MKVLFKSLALKQLPFMDHSLVVAKGLAGINETMSHAVEGHSRWTSQGGEF